MPYHTVYKLECNLIRVYTAISITFGSQNLFTQVLDTMLLDLFSFYLITFFSKEDREPVCFMESHFIEDNFSENFNSLK